MNSLSKRCGLLPVLVLVSGFAPVTAVENIRDDFWSIHPLGSTWPASTTLYLIFEADLTATDVESGLRFSIALQNPGTGPATLIEYVLPGIPNLPAAGAPVSVEVGFRLGCGPEAGTVRAEPGNVWLSYCHPTAGAAFFQPRPAGTSAGSRAAAEAFGLVLLDEHGTPGPHPTEAGALSCSSNPALPVASSADAWAELSLRKSARAHRIEEAGDSGTIGIYFDEQGQQCSGTIRPGEPGTIYILAKHNGLTDCGVAAAEFRISGIPSSWRVYPVPNPAALNVGNPFADGVVVAFPTCQRRENGPVVLYTVGVVASELENDLQFTVEKRNPPGNPMFQCPELNLCDMPMFTKICVEGRPCHVNATSPRTCDSDLPVQPMSWGAVKEIFR